MSILVDTGPTTLTKTWYVDGTPTDVGDVTVGVVDESGTEVVAPLTATTNNADGTYTYVLPVQAVVNRLFLTWSTATQDLIDQLDIIGGRLFTEAELRAYYGSDLSSEATFPDSGLAEARDRATAEFERICEVAFVPTYRRQTLRGTGARWLRLERPRISSILSATIGGVAQTVGNIAIDDGFRIWHKSQNWTAGSSSDPLNVVIAYVHGYDKVPLSIKRAAMTLARQQLVKDVAGAGVPDTASSFTDTTGQYVSFGANNETGRWYGIPAVDVVLRDYSMRVPVT